MYEFRENSFPKNSRRASGSLQVLVTLCRPQWSHRPSDPPQAPGSWPSHLHPVSLPLSSSAHVPPPFSPHLLCHLPLFPQMASLVHQHRSNPSEAYASKWLARLRHIKKIRTRVRPPAGTLARCCLPLLPTSLSSCSCAITAFPLHCPLQAQEEIQSRPQPGISLTQSHGSMQSKSSSYQQGGAAPNPESGQRKRLVSTVDDFTDFV